VADGDNLLEPQGLHNCFQIHKLLFKAVARAIRFVRPAEAQEVYRDGSAPGQRQVWNEVVIDVRVVRKSMQQHERWPAARKVADVQAAAIALNSMFSDGREICPLRIRRALAPFAWWSLSSTCSRAGTLAKPSSRFSELLESGRDGSPPAPNSPARVAMPTKSP